MSVATGISETPSASRPMASAAVSSPVLTSSASETIRVRRAAATGFAILMRRALMSWESMGAEMPSRRASSDWFSPSACPHRLNTSDSGARRERSAACGLPRERPCEPLDADLQQVSTSGGAPPRIRTTATRMHSAPPPTTSGEATRPRFRPAPEAPWTGAAGTAWADAPRPGAAGPPWTGAARAWATTGTGEACPGGAMAPISHPGAADHGPGEGLVCARTGRGLTPVTTPSAARTGTWRSSAPLLPAGRSPSDPQQGSDLVEDLDGLVDGGRRHDGGELLPGLGRAGGAPGDVGQKMRHEGPQRGAREPVRDKGRAVLTRAGPVSSSMRTTPTAYRSWAGSGSAPYLAPGDTWSGVPITWVTRASRGSASWQPGSRDKKTGRPREPGLRDGCRRAGVREDDVRRAARAQQDVGGLPSRWTSPAEWMTWRASSSWPMAGSTQACGNEP